MMDDGAKDRLQEIAQDSGGRLTPAAVVSDAKRKTSPLHKYFEWNDSKAAASWRIEVARRLIRSIHVNYTHEERTVSAPAYVRDPRAAEGEQGYVSIPYIRTDEDLKRETLVQEFARAGAALRRAKAIQAALDMPSDETESLAEAVETMRASFEQDLAA